MRTRAQPTSEPKALRVLLHSACQSCWSLAAEFHALETWLARSTCTRKAPGWLSRTVRWRSRTCTHLAHGAIDPCFTFAVRGAGTKIADEPAQDKGQQTRDSLYLLPARC